MNEWIFLGILLGFFLVLFLFEQFCFKVWPKFHKCSFCKKNNAYRPLSSYFLLGYYIGHLENDPNPYDKRPKIPWPAEIYFCKQCEKPVFDRCQRGIPGGDIYMEKYPNAIPFRQER